MSEQKVAEQRLARFGRSFALMINRATMYKLDHPYVKQSVEDFFSTLTSLLRSLSPVVFLMSQEQFFVEEVPLDPRVNIKRVVTHFKRVGVQSISFEQGVEKNELKTFIRIFSAPDEHPEAEAMKKAIKAKGISHLKINHVFYQKVTEDDEVISREAFEKISPQMDEDERKTRRAFMDMVLESVLTEEFQKTLSIGNLGADPAGYSQNMINTDLTSYRESDAEDRRAGPVLVEQLRILDEQVEKSLSGRGDVELSELANAVFEMKKQLKSGIEAQKALGVVYSGEAEILDKADEISDKVLIRLIKDEYGVGEISPSRMAHILRRMIPSTDEMKRLLPAIKSALMEEGMPLEEYQELVQELGKELQSDDLARILKKSSEDAGLDGNELIKEVKENPLQSSELIFLASEIRKGKGDEKALADLLVDYVERLGSEAAQGAAGDDGEGLEGEEHLRGVMNEIESGVLNQLKEMDLNNDVLQRLEDKINARTDEIFEKLRHEWISSTRGDGKVQQERDRLTVFQVIEQSVSEDEDLGRLLRAVRLKVEAEEVDENDFQQIYASILKAQQEREEREANRVVPQGVFRSPDLRFLIEKEIKRSVRYDIPFSALAFSLVKAKPKIKPPVRIGRQDIQDAVLERLCLVLRSTDIVGQLDKRQIIVLLPMTEREEAKIALRRGLKMIHDAPFEVSGVPLSVKVAGVADGFDPERVPNAELYLDALSNELAEKVIRIKNIQEYF